jgi:hypothetical protein
MVDYGKILATVISPLFFELGFRRIFAKRLKGNEEAGLYAMEFQKEIAMISSKNFSVVIINQNHKSRISREKCYHNFRFITTTKSHVSKNAIFSRVKISDVSRNGTGRSIRRRMT